MQTITLAVVGSRSFNDYAFLSKRLDAIRQSYHVTGIVSGGAVGPDRLAERYARENAIPMRVIRPQWNSGPAGQFNIRAGFERNTTIVEAVDRVVAFWDGESNGTRDTIEKARDRGKLLEQVNVPLVKQQPLQQKKKKNNTLPTRGIVKKRHV